MALFFCSCEINDGQSKTSTWKMYNSSEKSAAEKFAETWDGSEITQETAEENNFFYMGKYSCGEWTSFTDNAENGKNVNACVCTSQEITDISVVGKNDKQKLTICTYTFKNGKTVSHKKSVSPVCFYTVKEDNVLNYYCSDQLLFSEPSKDNDEYSEIPVNFNAYEANSNAGITFPFSQTFSSYADFEKFFHKYEKTLDLKKIKSDMLNYEKSGGFNAHIVFLYGDMAGSDKTVYSFVKAVVNNDRLYLYMKKEIVSGGQVSKKLFTAAVSGEYLENVPPEKVSWVIYSEEKL